MIASHHNFVIYALMIMKFCTVIELDVFYTVVTQRFTTLQPSHSYDVITSNYEMHAPKL